MTEYVLGLDQVALGDIEKVGGKNASLGEMIGSLEDVDVSVPGGFATTADAYREFLSYEGLADRINQALSVAECYLVQPEYVFCQNAAPYENLLSLKA